MLVLQYAEKGDMRHHLRHFFTELSWTRRLMMLNSLAKNLLDIHNAGFTHYDLHPGNVLIVNEIEAVISDFGLSRHVDDSLNSKVYGVMPYVAPEILMQRSYSEAADVYSFSMLMWEICSGKPPLSAEDHTAQLSVRICEGLRPEIEEGTPKHYAEMMKLCWDEDPTKRPTSKELYDELYSWLNKPTEEIQQEFEAAEKHRQIKAKDYDLINAMKTNPGAIYRSRLLPTTECLISQTSLSMKFTTYISSFMF